MGELFDRHLPAENLEWTGERLVGSVRGQVEAEHIHRYFLARQLCRGRDVLDIASGEGYGSALLAQTARSVIGVEIDPTAVAHSRASYASDNLDYRQGDARAIPLEDACVDCVVSFETIEHFYEHAAFLTEIRRVLRPGGFLLISSPDRDIYSPSGGHVNHHHLNELTRDEFEHTLRGSFANMLLLAQRPIVGSVLIGTTSASAVPITFERREGQRFEASEGLARPLYWVALASNVDLPLLPDSFFFEDTGLDAVAEIPLLRELRTKAEGDAECMRQERDQISARLSFTESEVDRLRRERESERRTAVAQAGELGAMRDRLLSTQAHADLLQRKLAEADNGHEKFLEQDAKLAAMSALLEASDTGKDKLAAQIAELTTGRGASNKSAIFTEITSLRARLDLYEQEAGAGAIATLRRTQLAVLGSLHRPPPVDVMPEGLSASDAEDYLTLSQSLLLDPEWYRANYADVANADVDPVLHYLLYGWREGRWPGPSFDGNAYLASNADVAKASINPLLHYLQYGVIENRPVAPDRRVHDALSRTAAGMSRFWFFVGDTIEWIDHHAHLTGVGHVTSELLFAAMAEQKAEPTILCVRGRNVSGLVRLDTPNPIERLSALSGRPVDAEQFTVSNSPYARHPAPGDHVFFTGVVWTDSYSVLFRHLTECEINFSVLIHDIIPIIKPDLVGEAYEREFTNWLTVTLKTASAVHVSNDIVKHQLKRWAVAAGFEPRGRIESISFGIRQLPSPSASTSEILDRVNTRFVLCVGTLDTRKNQHMLLQVWRDLGEEIGIERVPQLVLAGRDDLGLRQFPDFVSLFENGEVVLLEGLDDAEVAALYQACIFTVFPSISEGYGMPVAESLGYGKLCISAALPEVRAHAGDFASYFEPNSAASMKAALKQALLEPKGPEAANARILRDFTTPKWEDAYGAMRALAREALAGRLEATQPNPDRFAGTVVLAPGVILNQAETWCTDAEPEVSILIVNWNAAELTLDCIRQIWANTVGTRYQIIIADNGSTEDDLRRLRGLGNGITLIEIGCNRYFGEANNIAAERATGQYVCLLNNDAFVEDGWLDALLMPLHTQPDIGATGPLFLFADGRVQEAGAIVNEGGYPVRFGRDEPNPTPEILVPRVVDYISAAALLIDRSLFMAVGGFDLGYEPAYYEDTDLCLKLRAFGRKVLYCPDARVIHIEGSSGNGDSAAEEARKHMGDINRGKFVARWGRYLRDRDESMLDGIRASLPLPPLEGAPAVLPVNAPTAVVYTPFPLTPGGGERYLLSVVALLVRTHHVSLVTSHPYSTLRLRSLGAEFGLDLTQVALVTDPGLDRIGTPDIQVVMDNHIVPLVPARGLLNVFHCQFPFPLGSLPSLEARARLSGYNAIVVNSRFTAMHVEALLNGLQLPSIPISVVSPPVPQLTSGTKRPNRVLSVGRFFQGGHSKRHDLLIDAFRTLAMRSSEPIEFHIAGSSTPHSADMRYLADLMASAHDLPVHFHVNIAGQDLEMLYAEASVYWHGTGLGSDLAAQPWAAEHFGITVVEAMSAGVVPFALASGGPREIISDGIDGFLYDNAETLIVKTLDFLAKGSTEQEAARNAARIRAAMYAPEAFDEHMGVLLGSRERM